MMQAAVNYKKINKMASNIIKVCKQILQVLHKNCYV